MSDEVVKAPGGEEEEVEELEEEMVDEEEDVAAISTKSVKKDTGEGNTGGDYLFFGGNLTFEDAYSMEKEILEFLTDFAEDPTEYGVSMEDFTEKGQKTALQDISKAVANIHALDELEGRHNLSVKAVEIDFDNATLFLDTPADCLAWILSISAHPGPEIKSATEENFFLKLLGLYGTWIQHFYLDELPNDKSSNKGVSRHVTSFLVGRQGNWSIENSVG